jgi:hypothetical protein
MERVEGGKSREVYLSRVTDVLLFASSTKFNRNSFGSFEDEP